jgi:hypothetical protein
MKIIGPEERERSIDLIQALLKQFLMDSVSFGNMEALERHIALMRQQTEPLNVYCHLQTFPARKSTIIRLELSFNDGAIGPDGRARDNTNY